MNEIVELKKITKTYDGIRNVLDEVDLTIRKGELVGILGESGCGKSTLLNIIGLIDNYNSGEYIFNGTPIARKDRTRIRGLYMGFVFQLYYLIPDLTVRQNLQVPFLYKANNVARRNYFEIEKEILDLLGISNLVAQKVDCLSGGEKQRVALARAMMLKPLLLIADEPTGALDAANTSVVINALSEYSKTHSVVLVTHNVALSTSVDRAITLSGGKLFDA
jgi:ABC-type lipoprotein export system ATPase subunit